MEVFLRVSFRWDLLQLISGLFLTHFNERSFLRTVHPANSLSCEGHIIPIPLDQNENVFFVWSGRVVPFRFHLFQRDHQQIH